MQMDSAKSQDVSDPSRPLLGTDSMGFRYYLQSSQREMNSHSSTIGIPYTMREPENQKEQQKKSEIDGCRAWFTLACVFIINANTLGSLKVYGLIFEEIVSQKFYSREEASWPISTASTIQNLAGLLTPMLAMKISWRGIEIIQTVLFVGANVGAYYSNNLGLDILCLGVVQGVALSLRYNMNIVINNEYFAKFRATAMGISLAGSTFGVFALKPIIAYVLDISEHRFRNAYLALAAIVSFNIVLNMFIRKPKTQIRPGSPDSQGTEESFQMSDNRYEGSLGKNLLALIKNPNIHCIWIMQTIYFYISRTYTIFIVDYGVDQGLTRAESRNLLDFWVYGEISGRLLLGGFVDSGLLSLKWNMVVVCLLLSGSGFLSNLSPSIFTDTLPDTGKLPPGSYYLWFLGLSIAGSAAFSSLLNMLIVPFGQEYLGKRNVPWAFAIGSVVTSVFLFLRPSLVGLSRDYYKTYELLILVMSSGPFIFALLFISLEPILRRHRANHDMVRPSAPSMLE